MEFYFDDIETCECIGQFNNEYVYDVEVDDSTHTFIGNDILVHNSSYLSFEHVIKSCDTKDNGIDFILKLKKYRLDEYIKTKFDEYGNQYNTTNLQELELEKIAYSGLMMAKKKYILDLAWKEPNIIYKPQEKIKPTGVELVQGSTSKFARKALKEMLALILNKKKNLTYAEIIKKLKEYKVEFSLQDPEDISKTMSIGDYEKYILEDRKKLSIADKCPINVRAAGVYNHKVLNSKWKTKYNLIKTGDKIKMYHSKGESDIFGYLPNNYPYEFAFDIDYDKQFEKTIIEPLNRFVNVLGMPNIPSNLIFAKSLF